MSVKGPRINGNSFSFIAEQLGIGQWVLTLNIETS